MSSTQQHPADKGRFRAAGKPAKFWEAAGKIGGNLADIALALAESFYFHPPRLADPQQWVWHKVDRAPFTVEPSPGVSLSCAFIKSASLWRRRGTILMLHGHASCADHLAWLVKYFTGRGFNCVIYDARAHGRSGGDLCRFGLVEAADALAVARRARELFSGCGRFHLWEISMGAATGALALAKNDFPFASAVLIAPFSSFPEMVGTTLGRFYAWWIPGLKERLLGRCGEILGEDPRRIAPARAAAEVQTPTLVIHGSHDQMIPPAQGRAVFDALASPQKRFYLIEGAGHADIISTEKPFGKELLKKSTDWFAAARGSR